MEAEPGFVLKSRNVIQLLLGALGADGTKFKLRLSLQENKERAL